jgi:glycosyltransferase involved in cell wall biosynthesis
VLLIPNWLHTSLAESLAALPSKLGRRPSDPVRLLYSGNIGTKQGLLEFCRELQKSSARFDFRIHGDGGAAGDLRDWVSGCGDQRFHHGPLLEEPGFARAMHDADLFVITEKSGSGASFFPSKAIPAMASGTPILAVSGSTSPLGMEMRREAPGPWFGWSEVGTIGALLERLPGDPEQMTTWQRSGLRRAANFERERCLDQYQTALEEMVQDRTLARTRTTLAASPAT